MQERWKKSPAALLLALAGAAQAGTTITFEGLGESPEAPFMPLLTHGDEFSQAGYAFNPFSYQPGAQAGADLVGALVDGSQLADTCPTLACPGGNTSSFYAGLNDGVLAMSRQDGGLFSLAGFDLGFVGALGGGSFSGAVPLVMKVQGRRADNSDFTASIELPAPVDGSFQFAAVTLAAAFQATQFKAIFFYGLPCDASGSCTGFVSDQGQFALDNIRTVSAVPEPAAWLLTGLGLMAVAGIARRRRA